MMCYSILKRIYDGIVKVCRRPNDTFHLSAMNSLFNRLFFCLFCRDTCAYLQDCGQFICLTVQIFHGKECVFLDILSYFSAVPYTGSIGMCTLSALSLSPDQQAWLDRLCAGARSVAVVLFPYLVRDEGTLSLYARGVDYHVVIRDALQPVCDALQRDFPDNQFVVLADSSPIPEVQAAWLSGAGILGSNGLIFDRTYGSFVFIGTVITDLDCTPTASTLEHCPDCGLCRCSCPGHALDASGHVTEAHCLSALTQSKQELTTEQARLLREHPLIWGCDTCSLCCPLNRNAAETQNPVFRENRITTLTAEQLDGLTRKKFLAAFPDRAFTWRGAAPLVRNLMFKQEQD